MSDRDVAKGPPEQERFGPLAGTTEERGKPEGPRTGTGSSLLPSGFVLRSIQQYWNQGKIFKPSSIAIQLTCVS